jgi:hypothetical protein
MGLPLSKDCRFVLVYISASLIPRDIACTFLRLLLGRHVLPRCSPVWNLRAEGLEQFADFEADLMDVDSIFSLHTEVARIPVGLVTFYSYV